MKGRPCLGGVPVGAQRLPLSPFLQPRSAWVPSSHCLSAHRPQDTAKSIVYRAWGHEGVAEEVRSRKEGRSAPRVAEAGSGQDLRP